MPADKPHSGGGRPAIPGKLAPGMRLPRELVAESQRARLGIALVELVDAQGFAGTSLADLTARAHVARAAFYEHFGSMEACFTAAYDDHLARAAGQLVAAYNAPDLRDEQRAHAALSALAGFAQVWPAAARVCLGDVLTVARGTVEAREQEAEAVRALLDSALGADGVHTTFAPALAMATIGAIRRALYVQLRERPARTAKGAGTSKGTGGARGKARDGARAGELLALAEQLLGWVLVYGHELPARDRRAGEGASPDGGPGGAGSLNGDMGSTAAVSDDGPRERILLALLKLAANGAGESISLADVAATAGVSFGTFYKHFRTSQEALLAACEAVHERLVDAAREAYAAALERPAGDGKSLAAPERRAGEDVPAAVPAGNDAEPTAMPGWAAALDAALGAYLAAAAADPAATRTMVLGSLGLGRPGLDFLDRRAEALERLLGPGLRAHPELPAATADMLAGALLEVVHDHALRGCVERLPELHKQLTYIVLAPLLGAHEGHAHAARLLEAPHASTTIAAKRARARR